MRVAGVALLFIIGWSEARYLGKAIGPLSELHHGVRGSVYAVDARTLYLHDFQYDGEGPAAYFYVGTSKSPSASGALRLQDERGGISPLRRYRGEGITLSLPEGKTLKDVAWFSVWCDEYSINFGSVEIPRNLEIPKPLKVGALNGVHQVSSEPIVIVDAQTLLIPNFSYDGEAPDAKFWVGRGDKPSPQGIRIPDENGKETPLRKYDKKTIVLTLPGELTVFDIGYFAIWCEAFTVNFGHVTLPRATTLNIPPSLKMLGVSPQSRNKALLGESSSPRPRTRRPPHPARLQRLDATTYRPPAPLRAGPAPATPTQGEGDKHAHHRRDYTPTQIPKQQDIPSPSKANFEIQRSEEIEHNLQQHEDHFHSLGQKPNLDRNLNLQNYQPQYVHQHHSHFSSTEELLRQQQLYEQQRRALELELQRYQSIYRSPDPLHYRLLPQSENGGFRHHDRDLDPIQKSRSQ